MAHASVEQLVREAEAALNGRDVARGERLLKRALLAAPKHSRAHELLAYARGEQGDRAGALAHLRAATTAANGSAQAWYCLGGLLGAGAPEEALASFRRAIALAPAQFESRHDLGVLLLDQGRPLEALEQLDAALSLRPASFQGHHNRGRALQALRRHADAMAAYDAALSLDPASAATWVARGEARADSGLFREAVEDYRHAQALQPGNADARWNEALALLVLGDLTPGWQLYEARWEGRNAPKRRHAGIPAWAGDAPPAHSRLLVWWEQGFGDTIQFCRYVPMLAGRFREVVLEVRAPIAPLVQGLPGCRVVGDPRDIGEVDLQIPLLSLPRAFGTTLETIPASVPYLAAPRDRIEAWERRLGPRTGPRIGIAFRGHRSQKDNVARSIPLEAFVPLSRLAELHVLQVDITPEDRAAASAMGGRIALHDAQIADFADTAAIISCMDAVVSIDTAAAHLAGAMARPLWILLPEVPTWRWLTQRTDSPWYPTARLVRARAATDGAWQVEQACAGLVAAGIVEAPA